MFIQWNTTQQQKKNRFLTPAMNHKNVTSGKSQVEKEYTLCDPLYVQF